MTVGDRLKSLGPGLLWAGTAVGVSHLVQSTRAGAGFGLTLALLIIVANVLKYPAFEAAPRYTAATGKSLLQAYRRQGKWALWLFLALTVGTMFTVLAAVTIVTAGMASALISDALSPLVWSAILLAVTGGLLATGTFRVLESVMKVLMIVLTISTVIAAVLLAAKMDFASIPMWPPVPELEPKTVAFLVALVGWMPTAIDMSIWQSLWGLEKARTENKKLTVEGSRFDFNVGYIGTAVLALCFLLLGAGTLYGKGVEIPNSGGAFAAVFVELYANVLGDWSKPLVLIAAFSTMLSTTITCGDGFPRALETAVARLRSDEEEAGDRTVVYWVALGVIAVGALVIIAFFAKNLKGLVDLATTLSFLTAPVLAVLNLRATLSPDVPKELRPRAGYLAWHIAGIVFMGGLAAYYLLS